MTSTKSFQEHTVSKVKDQRVNQMVVKKIKNAESFEANKS